jgi:hypothetical protein
MAMTTTSGTVFFMVPEAGRQAVIGGLPHSKTQRRCLVALKSHLTELKGRCPAPAIRATGARPDPKEARRLPYVCCFFAVRSARTWPERDAAITLGSSTPHGHAR